MNPRNLLVKELSCNQCGKIFKNKNCKTSLFKHKLFCDAVLDFLKTYELTVDTLTKKYKELGSILEIMKVYPHWKGHTQYYKMFELLNINKSIKTSANNEVVKERRKITSLEKHGVPHNFSKNHPSRLKWEYEMLLKEGITNVFQRQDVKEKSIRTLIEKYGEEPWVHQATVRGKNMISSLNKKLFNILTDNDIEFIIELKLNREKGKYYAYDVLILNTNKIIEINGDYWHGNPKIYKSTDILLKGSSKEMLVKEKWEKDKNKIEFANKCGYSVFVVWESEIKNDIDNTIKNIINYAKS